MAPPRPWLVEDLERLARDEEVAGHEDAVVAVPLLERRLLDRGARRDAGVRDHDVDAAEAIDGGGEGGRDRVLARDVAADRQPAVAVGLDRVLGAGLVEVERDDAGARGGERVADRAADAAGAAGHERDLALQLARRRRLGELVELERPVLDREALGGVERDELAERLRAGHHLDRAVVEVARDRRVLRRRAGGDEPEVLDQHDPRVRVGRLASSRRRGPRRTRGSRPGTPPRARRCARAAPRRRRSRGRRGSTAARAWCARGGRGTGRRR